jgi:hypothetical protein
LSQNNIKKNELGQSTSKKLLKIFKFEDKIPAFSVRLSALMTVIQVFDGNSFFLVVRKHIESHKHNKKNNPGEKLRRLYLQSSLNWSKISCSFFQHEAVIIFKNLRHNISSALIIKNAIPKVFLAGLFPFSDFFTFLLVKNCQTGSNVVQITTFGTKMSSLKISHP